MFMMQKFSSFMFISTNIFSKVLWLGTLPRNKKNSMNTVSL